jgi:hypothetical protein
MFVSMILRAKVNGWPDPPEGFCSLLGAPDDLTVTPETAPSAFAVVVFPLHKHTARFPPQSVLSLDGAIKIPIGMSQKIKTLITIKDIKRNMVPFVTYLWFAVKRADPSTAFEQVICPQH